MRLEGAMLWTHFGASGPLRDYPGFDQIAQGFSGLMSVTGTAASGPIDGAKVCVMNVSGPDRWRCTTTDAVGARRSPAGTGPETVWTWPASMARV